MKTTPPNWHHHHHHHHHMPPYILPPMLLIYATLTMVASSSPLWYAVRRRCGSGMNPIKPFWHTSWSWPCVIWIQLSTTTTSLWVLMCMYYVYIPVCRVVLLHLHHRCHPLLPSPFSMMAHNSLYPPSCWFPPPPIAISSSSSTNIIIKFQQQKSFEATLHEFHHPLHHPLHTRRPHGKT